MKQGTVSILVGCHSPIHSYYVVRAWKKLYGRWPRPWQIACIFLHDIGHWGKDYLDNFEEKKEHWKLGAEVARKLYGSKGYLFTMGHSDHSDLYLSKSSLYYADKYSWYIASSLWIWLNCFTEPKLKMGYSAWEATKKFKAAVKKSIESGEYTSTHEHYLNRCKGKEKH